MQFCTQLCAIRSNRFELRYNLISISKNYSECTLLHTSCHPTCQKILLLISHDILLINIKLLYLWRSSCRDCCSNPASPFFKILLDKYWNEFLLCFKKNIIFCRMEPNAKPQLLPPWALALSWWQSWEPWETSVPDKVYFICLIKGSLHYS